MELAGGDALINGLSIGIGGGQIASNTTAGNNALFYNTTGYYNTAVGVQALESNTTGFLNTASGVNAMESNTEGYYNTAIGYQVMYGNTTGFGNSALGYGALAYNSTGSNNTALGFLANVSAGNYTNTTAIGYFASGTASNQVRIGNSSVSSIGGYADWTNISDERIKKNIRQDVHGLDFINLLKPVTYNYDLDAAEKIVWPDGKRQIKDVKGNLITSPNDASAHNAKEQIRYTGFLAQDVEAAANKIGYDFSGVDAPKNEKDLYGLRYAEFVIPLVKAVQELSAKNDSLETRITKLESIYSSKENSSSFNSNDGFAKLSFDGSNEITLLGQNVPNPFGHSTLIPFRIPKNCQSASIMIINRSTSEVVSLLPISCNEDHVQIDGGTLSSGSYSYSLYVNGKLVDTKQMILTR